MAEKDCGQHFRDYFQHLSTCDHCAEIIYWAVGNVAAYGFLEARKHCTEETMTTGIARIAATEFFKWTYRTEPPPLSDRTQRDWAYIGNSVGRLKPVGAKPNPCPDDSAYSERK